MLGLKVRSSVMAAIFRKSLKLERAPDYNSEILNLASGDCARLYEACNALHVLWSGPLEAAVILGLLCYLLDYWGLFFL